jgi:hypothetical protein
MGFRYETRVFTLLCGVGLQVAALTIVPQAAFAQNAGAAQKAFDEGKAAFDADKCDLAIPKLTLSDKLEPGSGTKVLLATCYERQGKFASAYNNYLAAGDAYRAAKKTERVDYVMARAKELEPKLQLLKIDAKERPVDLRLKLDGQDILTDTLGFEQPVDGGEHIVTAYAAGKKAFQATVFIPVGKKLTTVDIVLEAAPADYVPPVGAGDNAGVRRPNIEVVKTEVNHGARTAGWVMVGVGAAGLGTGAVLWVLSNSAQTAANNCLNGPKDGSIPTPAYFRDVCENPNLPPGSTSAGRVPDRDKLTTRSNGYITGGVVAAGVGLALVTTGIILVVTSGGTAKTTQLAQRGPSVTPVIGWNSVGLSGSF